MTFDEPTWSAGYGPPARPSGSEPIAVGAESVGSVVEQIRQRYLAKTRARETGLVLARETIRASANAIRAIHRHDFDLAKRLIADAGRSGHEASATLRDHPDILYAGFVHDAHKEYVEASLTLALIRGQAIPTPDDLAVEPAAYLNGLAEAVGELRRHLLDHLRRGEVDRGERLLEAMDEIYLALATIDFPDAMTGGLRRATDAARGIIEKTRGDLTVAIRQRDLEARLAAFEAQLGALDRLARASGAARSSD